MTERKTLLIAGRDERIVGYKAGENRILLGGPRMDAREVEYVPAGQLAGAVDLLDKLDAYVGHVNCGVVHGAPECTCGFDDLYTQVRAVVRRGR